jgi:outer membrane biosynthesis protein TonB
LNVELIGWHDEQSLDHRRRLRNAMLVSVALHGSIFAAFAVAPPRTVAPMPQFLAVELVAAPPSSAPASRPNPAPAPKAPPAPPETAPPEPPPPVAPPPPVVKAPVQVLPEESPSRIRKVKPEPPKPKVVAKVVPEPKSAPKRPKREKELSYEDAMAELGIDETEEFLEALPAPRASDDSSGQPAAPDASSVSKAGVAISPELAAWNRATQRRIQRKWVTPPKFRESGLATTLELRLSLSGELIGPPRVIQGSGDPYFDENAVRALLTAAPLDPPPKPGLQHFIFKSGAN